MTRYKQRLAQTADVGPTARVTSDHRQSYTSVNAGYAPLLSLLIDVRGCDTAMPLDRCENYTLLFDAATTNVATLTSCSVWGAMRWVCCHARPGGHV